jgi:MFS family permease
MIVDTPAAVTAAVPARRGGVLLMLVLLSGAPAMAMMFTVLGPVLPGLMQHFAAWGDGALIAQLVMTTPSIGLVLGGAPNGWLVERFGGAAVLKGSLFVYGLAGAAGLLLDGLPAFLVTRFVVGFTASGIATAALALVGEHFHDDARSRVLSYQTAAGAATGLVSLLLAGAVGQAWGWRWVFCLYLAAWPVLACAWWVLPRRRPDSVRRATAPALDGRFGLAGLGSLWHLYLLIIVVFIAVFMNAVQMSFLMAAEGITGPAVQSWVLAVGSIGNILGALSYGWLQRRLPGRRVFAFALTLMGVGLLLMGAVEGVTAKVVGSALSAAGAGAVGPYVAMLLLDRAAPAVRGRAAGLLYSATFIGDFLNPLAVTPLRLGFGIHGAFMGIGAACLAGAALALLIAGAGRPHDGIRRR